MCWSEEASAGLAAAGFISTAVFYFKGESKVLCGALAYFSLMELLQAYTYSVIDECNNPNNQIATFLGYMHIAFQPFFFNAVSMHFIPKELRQRISTAVYSLCFMTAIIFMMRIYPFEWASLCYEKSYQFLFMPEIKFTMPFCGEKICSTSGDWHIAWQIPASGSFAMANTYMYAAFLLPLLFGSWRVVIYFLISGPLLSYLTTNNMNEWAAVWCLYSIGLIFLIIKTPIRQYLFVNSWYGLSIKKAKSI
ncbi:MAG: hypothetical protein KAH20_14180 [Methylococcales bacterium]|nr:hypothetical protein [Methylococcales bacterium]